MDRATNEGLVVSAGFFVLFVNFCFLIGSSCYEVRAHWSRQKKTVLPWGCDGKFINPRPLLLSAIVLSFPPLSARPVFEVHLLHDTWCRPCTNCTAHSDYVLTPRFKFLTAVYWITLHRYEKCAKPPLTKIICTPGVVKTRLGHVTVDVRAELSLKKK